MNISRLNGFIERFLPQPPRGTAAMTEAPLRKYGESVPSAPTSGDRKRLDMERGARVLHAHQLEQAVAGLSAEAGVDDKIKQDVLFTLLPTIEKMSNPHELGVAPKRQVEKLRQTADDAGVLINSDGSPYKCEWPAGKKSIEVLLNIYQAVEATMAEVRKIEETRTGPQPANERTASAGPSNAEPGHPLLKALDGQLHPLAVVTKALTTAFDAPVSDTHGNEKNTLANLLAAACGVIVQGLENVITRELSPRDNIAKLEILAKALAVKAAVEGYADLGELALDRTLSDSEKVMHLDDRMTDIAEKLVSDMYEHGVPPDLQDLDNLEALRRDMNGVVRALQALPASDTSPTLPGSIAESELLWKGAGKLNDYTALLTTWTERLKETKDAMSS